PDPWRRRSVERWRRRFLPVRTPVWGSREVSQAWGPAAMRLQSGRLRVDQGKGARCRESFPYGGRTLSAFANGPAQGCCALPWARAILLRIRQLHIETRPQARRWYPGAARPLIQGGLSASFDALTPIAVV